MDGELKLQSRYISIYAYPLLGRFCIFCFFSTKSLALSAQLLQWCKSVYLTYSWFTLKKLGFTFPSIKLLRKHISLSSVKIPFVEIWDDSIKSHHLLGFKLKKDK